MREIVNTNDDMRHPMVKWLDGNSDRIQEYCTFGVSADQLNRTMATALIKQPQIGSCSRESVLLAVTAAARLGLDPTGDRNSAHFIPFHDKERGTELKLMIGYGGFISLIIRNTDIVDIQPECVYDGEVFKVHTGTRNEIDHTVDIAIRNNSEPERSIIAAYAVATYSTGMKKFVVLSRQDIDKARNASKKRSGGPWQWSFAEMVKKTTIRNMSKWLDLEPGFADALRVSDEGDGYDFGSKPVQNTAIEQGPPQDLLSTSIRVDILINELGFTDGPEISSVRRKAFKHLDVAEDQDGTLAVEEFLKAQTKDTILDFLKGGK